MLLVNIRCEKCGWKGYVKIVNNQAFCPKCEKNYDVTLETKDQSRKEKK